MTTMLMRLGLIGQLLDTISAGNKPQPAEALKPNNGYRPYDFGGGAHQ